MLIIQHQETLCRFTNNSANLKLGQKFKQGQAVAIIGNSGEMSPGPHLHFGVWYDGQAGESQKIIFHSIQKQRPTKHEFINPLTRTGKCPEVPVLDKDTKTFWLTLMAIICDDKNNEERKRMVTCEPYPDALEIINKMVRWGTLSLFSSQKPKSIVTSQKTWSNKHGFKYSWHPVVCLQGGNYRGSTIIW